MKPNQIQIEANARGELAARKRPFGMLRAYYIGPEDYCRRCGQQIFSGEFRERHWDCLGEPPWIGFATIRGRTHKVTVVNATRKHYRVALNGKLVLVRKEDVRRK